MRIIESDKVIMRLGREIDSEGNFSHKSIQKAVETISNMCGIGDSYNAHIRIIATHATREANNRHVLINEVLRATGHEIEVIDGIEEARLVYLGVRHGLPLNEKKTVEVDIGGGSTEIICATDDLIHFATSLKLGAVVLTKRFLKDYSEEEFTNVTTHVRSRLAPLRNEFKALDFEFATASSGTAKAIAAFHDSFFAKGRVTDANGYKITADELDAIVKELKTLASPVKVAEAAEIELNRAEILIPGAIVLNELTKQIGIAEWTVSTYGLREGAVADAFRREQESPGTLPDVQWTSIKNFAKRLGIDRKQAKQVSYLAGKIYEQLSKCIDLAPTHEAYLQELNMLKAAGYLFESGKFISEPQYHKHSYYLITNSRIPGFTELEREMIGLIARFHRKKIPSSKNKICKYLSSRELERLRILAAILRMAVACERGRSQVVKSVRVKKTESGLKVSLTVKKGESFKVEKHKLDSDRPVLEVSFDSPLEISWREQA